MKNHEAEPTTSGWQRIARTSVLSNVCKEEGVKKGPARCQWMLTPRLKSSGGRTAIREPQRIAILIA